jgi:hypothetical protein
MKIPVFYKLAGVPSGTPKETPEISDIRKQLEALRAEVQGEKDTKKRFEITRKIARLERFDSLQNTPENKEKGDIEQILAKKTSENYLGSDLLSLKKHGIDIASLVLVDEKS